MSGINSDISLAHKVRRPTVESEHPPLLLLMHGYGSNEEDLFELSHFLPGEYVVASVRAPLTVGSGAYCWYPLQFSNAGLFYDADAAFRGIRAASQVVDELIAAYSLDKDRTCLMGFSQGSIMSLSITLLEPEKVSKAVLMSGRLLPEVLSKATEVPAWNRLPVIATHGIWDDVLPVANGREIRDFLTPHGFDLTYREYPMAHQISQESLGDIVKWFTISRG